MIKRICPICGSANYSSDELHIWMCNQCYGKLTKEMNEPAESKKK